MAKTQPQPPGGDDREIGDAADLLRDTPAGWVSSTPKARSRPEPEDDPGGYDLAEVDLPPASKPPPLPFEEAPRGRAKARTEPDAFEDFGDEEPRPRDRGRVRDLEPSDTLYDPDSAVEEVWSRRAEWWPSLAAMGVVGLATWFCLFYVNIPTMLVLVVGLLSLLLLSYPIVITMERPVRITPEQAARDYFGALSHLFPHYRRMWLLLSARGRHSSQFDNFGEFRAYWKGRLAELNGGKPAWPNPFRFEVVDFKGEKSGGRSVADGKFSVKVTRGTAAAPPLDSVRVSADFVKGPDKMWYLDDGTL